MRNTRHIIKLSILISALALVGLVLAWFVHVAMKFGRVEVVRHTLSDFAGDWQVSFPEGSILVGSYREIHFLPDGKILARVSVPQAKVKGFIDSLPGFGKNKVSHKDRLIINNALWEESFSRKPRESWWNPDGMREFTSVDIQEGYQHMWVLASMDGSPFADVYLVIEIT